MKAVAIVGHFDEGGAIVIDAMSPTLRAIHRARHAGYTGDTEAFRQVEISRPQHLTIGRLNLARMSGAAARENGDPCPCVECAV